MNTPSILLQEQLPHGNAMFPFMIHEVSSDTRTEERIACHWHEEIEILVVTKGSAVLILNNDRYELKEGYVAFILPNHLHLVTVLLGDTFDFYAVVFHPDLLSSFIQDVIQQQYFDSVLQENILFPPSFLLRKQKNLVLPMYCRIFTLFLQRKSLALNYSSKQGCMLCGHFIICMALLLLPCPKEPPTIVLRWSSLSLITFILIMNHRSHWIFWLRISI